MVAANVGLSLPEPVLRRERFLQLPVSGVGGIIGDLQIPFHDLVTIRLFFDLCAKKSVKWILLNGDITDFTQLSDFFIDPLTIDYDEELDKTEQFLAFTRQEFPKIDLFYKEGNHEKRFARYLQRKAEKLQKSKRFSLKTQLNFDKYKIKHVEEWQIMKAGEHLHIIHGHELGKKVGSPANAARWLALKCRDIVLANHFHTSTSHPLSMLRGTLLSCWSVGCACDPYYWNSVNDWNQGFAFVDLRGHFSVENYKVINGRAERA